MAATAEDTDDFSFPATTAVPPPHFMDSPPLWRRPHQNRYPEFDFSCSSSSQEVSSSCHKVPNLSQSQDFAERFKICTFPEVKRESSSVLAQRRSYSHGDFEDERMDVLWEDLNEDHLSRNCVKMSESASCDANSSPGRAVQVRCIEALKLSKHRLSGKKLKILVFIKILKKVLAHRNSRRSIKKRAW